MRAITKGGRTLAAGTVAVGCTAAMTLTAVTPAHAAGFTVYTNERSAITPSLQQYGAIKSTVVYDAFHFTCDASACYSNGGALPSQATYEAKVKEYMGSSQFGGAATAPVVLDFEDIELTQVASGQASTNAYNLWRQLLAWTRNAAPSAPICNYGYDWLTKNESLIRQLHTDGLLDCFAPRAYWDSGETQSSWSSELNASVSHDRALAPSHPIYPYIHPKQISTGSYLSSTTWSFIIGQLKALTDGVVMWEPVAEDSSACNWVSQNSYEMGLIVGNPSSGPLKATASPPSGSCVVPRGTDVAVPVTITNTSGSTTAATSMVTIGGQAPGVHGYDTTWQYWNVPSLAPGATWQTTLLLAIDSTQTSSTVLLHLKTGLSDTRWAFIVQ